jgi:hypothetical protein
MTQNIQEAQQQHYEEVQDLLNGWNAPPSDKSLERLVGENPPEGDGRATAAMNQPAEGLNPFSDKVDAQRLHAYTDDGDSAGGDGEVAYEDKTNDELRDELEKRGLSKSGNKQELINRLEEDDASEDDEDDDGE